MQQVAIVELKGKLYSHILNPTTGLPVSPKIVSVSVVHKNAAQADAWATALSVMTLEDGLKLANDKKLAVYYILMDQGKVLIKKSIRFAQQY